MSLLRAFKLKLKKIDGRNIHGRICVFHRGGGLKRLYRAIDIHRRLNCFGTVQAIRKTSYHTALIGRVVYENGLVANSILTEEVSLGDMIFSGAFLTKEIVGKVPKGSTIPLYNITLFNLVSNIESYEYSGAKLLRAAGTAALYIERSAFKSTLKLPSGWLITIDNNCLASLGRTSNSQHKYLIIKKAGDKRKMGWRPTVRGVVKNPCDHPHGGGEGKGSPPAAAVSPWGRLTKGTPTKKKIKDILKRRTFRNV